MWAECLIGGCEMNAHPWQPILLTPTNPCTTGAAGQSTSSNLVSFVLTGLTVLLGQTANTGSYKHIVILQKSISCFALLQPVIWTLQVYIHKNVTFFHHHGWPWHLPRSCPNLDTPGPGTLDSPDDILCRLPTRDYAECLEVAVQETTESAAALWQEEAALTSPAVPPPLLSQPPCPPLHLPSTPKQSTGSTVATSATLHKGSGLNWIMVHEPFGPSVHHLYSDHTIGFVNSTSVHQYILWYTEHSVETANSNV